LQLWIEVALLVHLFWDFGFELQLIYASFEAGILRAVPTLSFLNGRAVRKNKKNI